MARPNLIELPGAIRIPVLYEDRSVLAVDKPPGWLLAPSHWRQTQRNLQAALEAGIEAGAFWARARNLRFLRFVHRLDAETSGVLLLARSRGAVGPLSELFERREVTKRYLAVVYGVPERSRWTCRAPLAEDPEAPGRMRVDRRDGKEAETLFVVLADRHDAACGRISLVEAQPSTGRTHQIRVHLLAAGTPVVGDPVYRRRSAPTHVHRRPNTSGGPGRVARPAPDRRVSQRGDARVLPLALRAVELGYTDPFSHRRVRIQARDDEFLRAWGFAPGGRVGGNIALPWTI